MRLALGALLGAFRLTAAGFSEGLVLHSLQRIGTDYQGARSCSSERLRDLNGKIFSDYEVTPNGANWEAGTVILSMDAQSQLLGPVDPKLPIGLRLSLGFVPRSQKTWIYASRVGADLPGQPSLTLDASMGACGIPTPGCVGSNRCYANKPPFDWSEMPHSTRAPSSSVLTLNVTGVVDPKDITVQVWAVPEGVTKHARWASPTFTVLNWRFQNLDASDIADSDLGGSGWGDDTTAAEDEAYAGFGASGEESIVDNGDSGADDAYDSFEGADEDDAEGDEEAPPAPMVSMFSKAQRYECPLWQSMACLLDVMEKTCSKDVRSPGPLVSKKSGESLWICCCPYPYKQCKEDERNEVCDAALQEYVKPLGDKPSRKALGFALQKARGQMRDSSSTCSSATVPAEPLSVCGKASTPKVRRPLARQNLFCEILTWQNEEFGDGDEDEFEANGCPYPKKPGKPGDSKWREGKADWSGH